MKRLDYRSLLASLSLLAPAWLGVGQGCNDDLRIGFDAAGAAGAAVAGSGNAGSGNAGAGVAGQGASGAGAAGSAGQEGTDGFDRDRQCKRYGGQPEQACGRPCGIDGINEEFVCNEAGHCVVGPVVCGSGLCAGKTCGEECGNTPGPQCDAIGRCVSGPIECGAPPDLCAGKPCGEGFIVGGSVCHCDGEGRCLHNGPIYCGPPDACQGLACGFDACPGAPEARCACNGRCVAAGPRVATGEVSPRCQGRTCGADCSLEGLDLTLSCTPEGYCVSTPVSCEP